MPSFVWLEFPFTIVFYQNPEFIFVPKNRMAHLKEESGISYILYIENWF